MASHPSVRMVSETVKVRLSDKAARVHCEFTFKNEGKQCAVKMGFPEQSAASGEGGLGILYGFRSWVDGKPVKCTYKRGKEQSAHEYESSRDSWYVKDVPFEAGQTRKVVDEYSSGLDVSANSMQTSYEIPWSFTYVLRTGRNWKGTIGKATIILDVSRVDEVHYEIVRSPAGSVRAKDTLTWTFTDFEPTEDISIDLVPRFPKLNGKMADPEQWWPFTRVNGVTMTGSGFLTKLGAKMKPPDSDGALVIHYGSHILRLTPGSKTAVLDGKQIKLQAAPTGDVELYPWQIPTADVVRALGGTAWYSQKEGRLVLWLKDLSAKSHEVGERR